MKDVILVTGGHGFLGKHVLPKLINNNIPFVAPRSRQWDLTDSSAVTDLFSQYRPYAVLHMAAVCGGIGANKDRPADFVLMNSQMTCNIFNEALKNRVKYIYTLGSVCSYPKHCPVPFKEDDIWNGYPEETNAPYGMAKRLQLVMQQAFRQQWGIKGAHFIPVNLFGEYDNFDLKTSHVIPALIRKFIEASPLPADDGNFKPVEIWGTGEATREFLYAGDCADAIVSAIKNEFTYDKPINLGTGKDISIHDLAKAIQKIVGHDGELKFTGDVAINGQPKRRLDVSRAKKVLGFEAKTTLEDGLGKTIDWYYDNECREDL